jgi:hypothetical protein
LVKLVAKSPPAVVLKVPPLFSTPGVVPLFRVKNTTLFSGLL